MINYPKVNDSGQRIVSILAKWYQLGTVELNYSDSIALYCEVIPEDKKYLKVKIWLTKENQFSIYEDIEGGLEHRDFVKDMAKYLEIIDDLDLGEVRIEKWDGKAKEYKLNRGDLDKNCFGCYYRSHRGYCDLLENWHPKKENNDSCVYWTSRDESVV